MGSTSGWRSRTGGRAATGARAGLFGLLGLAVLACGQAAPSSHRVEGGERLEAETLAGGGATERAPLRVGTSGDYTPFSLWPEGESEPHGFSTDVARAFARDHERRIEWVRFRWPELEQDLESGRFDVALSGITIRPERSLAGRFALPLTATGAVALVLDTSVLRTRADLDRAEIRLAVNRGGHLERVARSLFPRAEIEPIADNARVPEQLVDGRADAVVTDDLEAPHWQSELPPSRAIGPFTRDLKAAWFPIGSEESAREFDRWLLHFEATGALARLRERHGLADRRTAAALSALLASLDERLSLMPAVAHAKRALGLPIEDRAQEERVQEAVRLACLRAAREFMREPPGATALHRFVDVQLRAARFVQERELAASASSDREAARRDLDQRIRPAIAFVTQRVAWLLVAASGTTRAPSREAISQALARHALPTDLEAEIHASLEALLTPPRRATRVSPAPPTQSAPQDITPSG